MLSAAESSIEDGAEDDNERKRVRAKLYAPPAGTPVADRRRMMPRLDQSRALALAAKMAAEDARLTGERTG